MSGNSVFIKVLLVLSGVASAVVLFYFYREEIDRPAKFGHKDYIGTLQGPKTGRLKFINIISDSKVDCIKTGFYLYFKGIDIEDFVIVTDSVRASFGDISSNIIGEVFRFDRLMKCRSRVENKDTFLILAPPVMLEKDNE